MRNCWCFLFILFFADSTSLAAELKAETVAAFDRYIRLAEKQMDEDLAHQKYLSIDTQPDAVRDKVYEQLHKGEVLVERRSASNVPDGLIHHWVGRAFIPGASLDQVLKLLKSYNDYPKIYAPEVVQAQILKHQADEFKVALRLRKHKVVSVLLVTEYEVHFTRIDPHHAYSRSYSTRIAEVEHPSEPSERELPPGNDHGFLWRIYTYWHLVEKDNGVYAQCEAISLTRDVPAGLGWLVGRFIESIPRESLLFTLDSTRNVLSKNSGERSAALSKNQSTKTWR